MSQNRAAVQATRRRMKSSAWLSLRNTAGSEPAVAFADHDDNLALTILIAEQATVAAVLTEIRGFDIAAEVTAIDLCDFAVAAKRSASHFLSHRFAEFVQRHESGFVGEAEIPAHCERRLAFDLVAKDRDGREVGFQRQLVRGKQRPGRNAEILATSAALKTGRAVRTAAIVGVNTAAMRATPSACSGAQRTLRKAVSASWSVMRNTDARESVLAAAERRKC